MNFQTSSLEARVSGMDARTTYGELDAIADHFDTDPSVAMQALLRVLEAKRNGASGGDWKRFCMNEFQRHPVMAKVHRSPFAKRGYEKPRGYAGDGVMLDMAIAPRMVLDVLDPMARAVFEAESSTAIFPAIRTRRDAFARLIDEVATANPAARIACIGCTHLREAQLSQAANNGAFAEFLAMDPDVRALQSINNQQPRIRTIEGSVRHILSGEIQVGNYDLIYSSTALEPLAAGVAARLTRILFDKLAPGGKLVLACFSDAFPAAAYMEAALDWWIVYRGAHDMRQLASLLDPNEVGAADVFTDPAGHISFLGLGRAA